MKGKTSEHTTLGVDLGYTNVRIALVDTYGHIMSIHEYPTNPEKGSEKVIAKLMTNINACLSEARQEAQALGIGIAAQVDSKGVVHHGPNLEWRDVPLKDMLQRQLRMPVVVTNDVRAAAWGEWRYGSGKGANDLVVLFVGTGIGGGVISGGNLIVGCSNTGGELGHINIVVDGRKCHCPNRGCLEAYAGGWALAERAQEAVRADPKRGQRLTDLAGGIEKITAATVGQTYHEGNQLATRMVEETGQYLAAGAISIVNAFNPCLLVLGGGVIEGLPHLVYMVEESVRKRALTAATENLRIVKASLGSDAGVIGAATLAQNKKGETT